MFSDRRNMGRKRKNIINPHKVCSARYCNNRTNIYGTDSYCDECRKYANQKRELKKKGLYGGNFLYVYQSHLGALYVGLTHNYEERHKQHLKSDKVFIEEDLWQHRVVYEFDDKLTHKELEYLEYVLIQYHKTKSQLLTNHQKMNKVSYDLIPEERKKELKILLCEEMKKNNVVNVNYNYNKEKMQNVDINYLQKCKKILQVGKREELEDVI